MSKEAYHYFGVYVRDASCGLNGAFIVERETTTTETVGAASLTVPRWPSESAAFIADNGVWDERNGTWWPARTIQKVVWLEPHGNRLPEEEL